MLVDLKPIGGAGSVNPEYVTSVETEHISHQNREITKIWVRGNSGYGTYSKTVAVTSEEARQYLNNPNQFLLLRYAAKIEKALRHLTKIAEAAGDDSILITSNEVKDNVCAAVDDLVPTMKQMEELADNL